MAAEVSSAHVNGNYGSHQAYSGLEQPNDQAYSYSRNAPPQSSAATASHPSANPPSKDEVGWYFVEQYYLTLSRNPDKVYLFYNKRSQFVSGHETDKVAVCVGQRAINDRFKELEFQDTKVRVTNVDSQASDSNIVIQVIGEISNKSQPHRKFVQTFVLATQTNGYFVLNDIFRYLIDEEDQSEEAAAPEEAQQAPAVESSAQEVAPSEPETEAKTLTSSQDPTLVEDDAKKVDQGLEDKVLSEPATSATAVNGVDHSEDAKSEQEEAPAATPEPAASTELSKTETKETDLQAEKPKDPEPTPAASPPPKQAPAQPAPAPKPAAPKTWASLAASAVATPAAPSSTASSNASQQKPAPAASKPNAASTPSAPSTQSTPAAPAAPSAPAAQRDESPAGNNSQDEWTAVGGSHNRQQSRQTNQQQQQQQPQGPQTRGYIKNVFENIDSGDLRASLERHGELTYFDVSRQKVSHHSRHLSG